MTYINMTNKNTQTNSANKKLTIMLESVGLTSNDSSVYLYLQERGSSISGSKIAFATKLHRQYVYNSLEKLTKLNLIESIKDGARFKYKALSPVQVTKLARRKLDEAEEIERELKTISTVGAEQDFEVYMGEKAVLEYETKLMQTLPDNTKQYIIGGSSDTFIQFFGDLYNEIAEVTSKKGLESYYVACKEEMPWPQEARKVQKSFRYKILHSLPKTAISTVVRNDTVGIYSMVTPPLIYVIKSKRVADDYKKFFDMLWEMAVSDT